MRRRPLLAGTLGAAVTALAGCSLTRTGRDGTSLSDTPPPSDGARETPALTPFARGVGYTHVQPTGNRVLTGRGSVPEATPLEYEPAGQPTWLAALPSGTGTLWAVATAEGVVHGVRVVDGRVTDDRRLGTLPAGTPPALALFGGDDPTLVARPDDAARWSHPVPAGGGRLLYVDDDGGVVLVGEGAEREPVGALPDARIVRVTGRRYALLGGRTRRYAHGALGDGWEASTIVTVDVESGLAVETRVELPSPAVVEAIAPIAADLDGDGTRELLVTVSDSDRGGRLAVVSPDGRRLATGPGFSTGFRWRHPLAVAPFGPDGGLELAAVETPHIGGTARFHRLSGGALEVVAALGGVSSHAIGSRNLDGALAGDLDGDGRWELLVPTQRRDELLAVRRVEGGAETAWRLDLPGALTSNVAGVALADGALAVGAGGADGTVRLWHP